MKLIYKATIHGDKASDFWSKCENEGNVFVFVKSTSGHRFGGYRQVTFTKSNSYKTDAKAFLFSLTHALKCNLKNSNGEMAVTDYHSYLPGFGGGSDLSIDNNCFSNTNSYSYLGRTYETPYKEGSTEAKSFLAGSYHF